MKQLRISQRVGAIVALASCAAMLASVGLAASANAADTFTYNSADNFISGDVDPSQDVTLTVTKYRRSGSGDKPWGSVLDKPGDGVAGSTPLAGAKFKLYQVEFDSAQDPCNSAADLEIDTENAGSADTAPTLSCGELITPDSLDQQAQEQATPSSGRIQWRLGHFTAVKYYVLQETNIPQGTSASKTTLFGLPYATFNTTTDEETGTTTTTAGHIYSVSVFPKDTSTRQFDKSATGGNKVVQVGDEIPYSIDQTIYNKPGAFPPGQSDNTQGDGYLDVSEIGTDSQGQIRVVDRLSSALTLKEGPKVTWSCKDENGDAVVDDTTSNVIPATDYKLNLGEDSALTADPGLLPGNQPTDPDPNLLFTDGQSGSGTKYVTIDLWKDQATANNYKTSTFAACKSAIIINVSLTATVTGAGDDTAGVLGSVSNSAAVDIFDGTPRTKPKDPPSTVSTAAAGFQFAKTDSTQTTEAPDTTTKATPVAKAKFRLSDPADTSNTKFLLTNGEFGTAETGTAKFVTAESSSLGVVSFTGLPLFTSAQYEDGKLKADAVVDATWTTAPNNGKLNLVEYEAPDPYATPSGTYGTVTFTLNDGTTGTSVTDLANIGTVPPTTFENSSFGTYKADPAAIKNAADAVTDSDNKPFTVAAAEGGRNVLTVGMKNFTPEEAPIGLPLTGGEGIVIFLIVGAAVMGITLYVNHRRNKANVTA